MIDRKGFIATMLPVARDEEKRSGIKPLITVMQAAHESRWGDSELTRKANNLFGVTGDGWAKAGKPVFKIATREYVGGKWLTVQRPFRYYASWAESIRDWAALLALPRYAKALEAAKQSDVTAYAKEIVAAGYATDPNYAKALEAIGAEVLALAPELGHGG